MSFRYLAGFITTSYNPLKVPNAPTLGTVTPASGQVTVAFTAPSNVGGGAITSYIAIVQNTSTGVAVTGTGASSPITVTGLTNGQTYNVKVAAVNTYGPGPYSAPSANFSYAPKLYSWGTNNEGELGLNNRINRSSPVQVGLDANWAIVSTSVNSSVSIKTDGTLWSWGNNVYGQLGLNDANVSRSSPTQVGALTNWSNISGTEGGYLAVKTDGTLWSWGGANFYGELGQNNRIYYSSPTQVGALTNWSATSGGFDIVHSMMLKTDGTLWTCGANAQGQLGQNNLVARSSPVQVGTDTNWSKIAAGGRFSIATKTNGTLWSWGQNSYGQLGQSDRVYRSSPVQVGALTTWLNISGGSYQVIAIKTDGTLWTWGGNPFGQLGQNDTVYRSSPVQVGSLATWSTCSASKNISAAIKTDGTLWTWGQNNYGQIGQNNTTYRSSPVQVGALTNWLRISQNPGAVHVLGLLS